MKFSFLLPHVGNTPGTYKVLEIANKLQEIGHAVTIYHPDGGFSDWFPIKCSVAPLGKVTKINHEILVYSIAPHHSLYVDIYNRGYCKVGVYLILDEEIAVEHSIDYRQVLQHTETIKIASCSMLAKYFSENSGNNVLYLSGAVDNRFFKQLNGIKKIYPLLSVGYPTYDIIKGSNIFNEACVLLNMKGHSIKAINPQYKNLPQTYNEAEYFVSTSFIESWNIHNLEAMSCGTPVITTFDWGSMDYAVNKVNSLVVRPGSSQDIKLAVMSLKESKSLRDTIIAGGLETSSKHNWDTVVDKFLNIIDYVKPQSTIITKEETVEQKIEVKKPEKLKPISHDIDIVIPIFNSLKYVKACINSVLEHSESYNYKLILVNDCSDEETTKYLDSISDDIKIEVITNSINEGYLKSINKGLSKYRTNYKVCLNSDVIVTKGWLDGLIKAANSDQNIGIVCPLTNNGSTLTLAMPRGSNFIDVNELLSTHSKNRYPEACTVVGFCMLIKQIVIDTIGVFDTSYNPGYYEECEYQYVAKEHGYKSIICESVYVYHKGQATFKKKKEECLRKNRVLFHQKWDDKYMDDYKKYDSANVLGYLREKQTNSLTIPINKQYDVLFIVDTIDTYGDSYTIFDIVDAMILKGISASVAVIGSKKHIIPSYFNPLIFPDTKTFLKSKVRSRVYIATCYNCVEAAISASKLYDSKTLYFIQDFDGYSDKLSMQHVIDSYSIIRNKLVASSWIQDRLKVLDFSSDVINPGVNTDIFYPRCPKNDRFTVIGLARPEYSRGFKDLKMVFHTLRKLDNSIEFRFFGNNPDIDFPNLKTIDRDSVANLMSSSHVFVNASTVQGYSLTSLEMMACGGAVVTTANMGVQDYCEHNINSLVSQPNDPLALAMNVLNLKNDDRKYFKLVEGGMKTAKLFSLSSVLPKYIKYITNFI